MYQLPVRQIPAWASDLDRRKVEFDSLRFSTDEVIAGVAGWLLLEHVQNDLALDGRRLDRTRLAGLLDGMTPPATGEEAEAVDYGMAVRYLSDYASRPFPEMTAGGAAASAGLAPELTLDLLQSVHRIALSDDPAAGQWRQDKAIPLYPSHDPALPQELPRLLEITLGWFSSEGARDLHPIEQAALVHLRLYELQPFDRASGRISRLAAGLYTIRTGLPPIILDPSQSPEYYRALLSGFQMTTTPLVEVFARACSRTLQHMIQIALESSGRDG